MMDLTEFKRRARETFGQDLEHATPANVSEFVATLHQEMWKAERAETSARSGNPIPPIELDHRHCPMTYEASVRQFFSRALDVPNEQALLLLWLYALDLAYAGIEQLHSDAMNKLFLDDTVN